MGSYDRKIREGPQAFLLPGEQVLASIVARPRGWTQAMAGGRGLGRAQMRSAINGAVAGGFALASPMALVVTNQRLLSLHTGSPTGLGIGGKVKDLAGASPLREVDAIEIHRLAIGKTLHLTINGEPFILETNAAADAKGLVAAFESAKAAAGG